MFRIIKFSDSGKQTVKNRLALPGFDALFASDPECSDYSTYSLLLLHKMKNDTSYECVFTEDFREDSHGEW